MGKSPIDFYAFAQECLDQYLKEGKIGTYTKNKSTLKKLKTFNKVHRLDLQDMTSNTSLNMKSIYDMN